MIRLPKLFKRNPETEDLDRGSARGRRTINKLAPRSFQRAQENEELALTEDPEQQRARHRLIGAAVLVLIAVVGLPRILDNKPKSVNNDIAVNIVTSLPAPNAAMPVNDEKAKPETVVETLAKDKEVAQTKEVVVAPTPEAKSEAKASPKTAPTASNVSSIGLAAGEEVVAASNTTVKAKTEELPKKVGSGKYVIQIGAFASEERAKGWITKMKDQKIPNYVLNKTAADGTKLYVLRAGPFTDKDAAEAAEKKVKVMGLSPRLVEVGAP
ncbi:MULTISPECIES: SPOR domain-containing protein [unclassified Polynucleobacter]|jgi:DedD protein|uniref:SPOR domain-containing protein n=1 Tax=unclassified Polynucleobacter TaxID=2640945 RepID=UPI000BC98761|nr:MULTISPECIES: SPOR domain-containing protein [unclassified Polynucleobacter]OYY21119.1 MAG: sporulation protein [Polynucleobacter sp. 35-46-11]OZA74532.1 MAG: sporulation protein [Polynucleobacter sp. 39-46-10]